jgi:hypothetical protein
LQVQAQQKTLQCKKCECSMWEHRRSQSANALRGVKRCRELEQKTRQAVKLSGCRMPSMHCAQYWRERADGAIHVQRLTASRQRDAIRWRSRWSANGR